VRAGPGISAPLDRSRGLRHAFARTDHDA
jgi:hypothetical protein